MGDLGRAVLRLIGAGAVLASLVAILTPVAMPLAPVPAAPAPVSPTRPADSWAVEVDGWHIVVDGVAVSRAQLADDLPAVADIAPDEFRGYGALIGRYAEEADLDWRLVAAVAFEESRFDPYAVSPAGAFGLMQVRDIAARHVGAETFLAPDANVRAGVRYLRSMADLFAAARGRDRDALMLAAYNMGPSHVLDAQSLARELGFSPLVWDGSMDEMVRLLEQPVFYDRLPNGYAQGTNVVAYVDRVLARYAQYRRRFPSEPLVAAR